MKTTMCPCKNCLVYIRCKQKIKKTTMGVNKEVYYIIDDLINDCPELRKFFGVDTLMHKIEIRNLLKYNPWVNKKLMLYLINQPRGDKLMEEFLNVMGFHELPNMLNPKIRIEIGNKK